MGRAETGGAEAGSTPVSDTARAAHHAYEIEMKGTTYFFGSFSQRRFLLAYAKSHAFLRAAMSAKASGGSS